MKIEFSRQIFEKYTNIRFHENLFSGIRVVPFVRMDGQSDMPKPFVAFRNFAKEPNNICLEPNYLQIMRFRFYKIWF
jgi:hypothetical protein